MIYYVIAINKKKIRRWKEEISVSICGMLKRRDYLKYIYNEGLFFRLMCEHCITRTHRWNESSISMHNYWFDASHTHTHTYTIIFIFYLNNKIARHKEETKWKQNKKTLMKALQRDKFLFFFLNWIRILLFFFLTPTRSNEFNTTLSQHRPPQTSFFFSISIYYLGSLF